MPPDVALLHNVFLLLGPSVFEYLMFVTHSEIRAVPLINPGRSGFEDLRVHFLTEKEQQQKEKLLKDYLMLIEIPVIGLGYDPTQIITAARYELNTLLGEVLLV